MLDSAPHERSFITTVKNDMFVSYRVKAFIWDLNMIPHFLKWDKPETNTKMAQKEFFQVSGL